MSQILVAFIVLRFAQYIGERYLSYLNRQYYLDKNNQQEAIDKLGVSKEDLDKSLDYASDRYVFGRASAWFNITATLVFLAVGGLGVYERIALELVGSDSPLSAGLVVFGLLGLTMFFVGVPFSYYNTFVIEEKHGFNRQTRLRFFVDLLKSVGVGVVLGGLILATILWIMQAMGEFWWFWAWVAMSGYSMLTMWLYPSLLAPLFNKFSPLADGELKDKIYELAKRVDFGTSGLFVMDASIRSSHGNAYFTGVFGEKRIVLFDTLIEALSAKEIVAVLAHELGHFKLNHVRWMLLRSIMMTGVTFYLLSLCLPLEDFYHAFGLAGVSNYGALIVFSLWFGLLDFVMQPLESYLSRRNEFAADRFALDNIDGKDELGAALLKLREKSHSMPISHPWFSMFYYSHPPMIERLNAMKLASS